MVKTISGNVMAEGKRFAVVAARFNDFVGKELVAGCLDTLARHGAEDKDVELVWVPGCFEIPVSAAKLAATKRFDAVICLGVVIRGATPHFEYIAAEVAKGVANVGLNSGLPVIFGVITADSIEQAIERAGSKDGNKGRQAAVNAIEMANLLGQI
ncbi:MAG: 6,7-dimethyl-8-ribityllumazine synthase [Candidatus Omnitrophota bacterium]